MDDSDCVILYWGCQQPGHRSLAEEKKIPRVFVGVSIPEEETFISV